MTTRKPKTAIYRSYCIVEVDGGFAVSVNRSALMREVVHTAPTEREAMAWIDARWDEATRQPGDAA